MLSIFAKASRICGDLEIRAEPAQVRFSEMAVIAEPGYEFWSVSLWTPYTMGETEVRDETVYLRALLSFALLRSRLTHAADIEQTWKPDVPKVWDDTFLRTL